MVDYKKYWLGVHKSKEKAVAARKAAERELGFHKNHGTKRAPIVHQSPLLH